MQLAIKKTPMNYLNNLIAFSVLFFTSNVQPNDLSSFDGFGQRKKKEDWTTLV